MTEATAPTPGHKTGKVGSLWRLPTDPAVVTLPDGESVTVTGRLYVLTTPGVHTCGSLEIEAQP